MLLRFGWLLTGDPERAQDLLQDALVRVMPHWDRISVQGPADVYVRRVMVNLNRSWWRRRLAQREVVLGETELARAPELDETSRLSDRLDLQRALRRLPPGQRAVVVLRYYEGYSEVETARLMGCQVGTIKSQSAKGLKKLRGFIPGHYFAERSTSAPGGMEA